MAEDNQLADELLRQWHNPPKGSKIEAAKSFGIDLTLTACNLRMSPTERIQQLLEYIEVAEELKRAGGVAVEEL